MTATQFTDSQKRAFVALAQQKGRAHAAKKAKVSAHTISDWARKQKVDLRVRPDGKANGHTAPEAPFRLALALPQAPTPARIESVRAQLVAAQEANAKAIASLDALQQAWSQVLG